MTAAERCPACDGLLPEGRPCPSCSETVHDDAGPRDYTGPRRIERYTILREIGAGGMGTVFEAFDEPMERRVALKVLSRHASVSDRADRRFAQEAWIAGKLNHPNLVKVYERGTWEDLSFYSMELIEGGSLADVVSNMRRWGRDDRLGLEFKSPEYLRWAIEQVIAAARGLDYAHRNGVVHRDIKPMNLLLDREVGALKIADFGLAIDSEATRMTTAGKMLGTPVYMAPEQILGKQDAMDARTDVYALGVTLFELLTLELPYSETSPQLYLNAVLTTEARRASKLNHRVGRDLEIVIRKALEKHPHDRYPSAADFAADLESVLNLRPIRAVPPGRIEQTWKWMRRKPVHASLVAVLTLSLPALALLVQRTVEHRRLNRQAKLEELLERMRWLDQRTDDAGLVDVASEVLGLDPENIGARRTRSVASLYLALELRERDAAPAQVLELQALDDAARLVEQHPRAAWPHELQAFVLSKLGREEEARRATLLSEERGRELPSALDRHFGALNALAAGEPERAATLLSELIAVNPGQQGAFMDRARAYERMGRLQEAIEDTSVALGLNPDDRLARYNLGVLLTRAGRPGEGARFLDRAYEVDGYAGLSDNSLARGRAAQSAGQPEQALELFRQAEREARAGLEPGPLRGRVLPEYVPWLHLNLGVSLMEQHRLASSPDDSRIAEAASHYGEALALLKDTRDPRAIEAYGFALGSLCDLLIQTRSLDRALEVCREATERLPDVAATFYNLAGVHALAGRKDEALTALERDFELGDRDWGYLAGDPWFESLHDEPAFQAILERMKRETPGSD